MPPRRSPCAASKSAAAALPPLGARRQHERVAEQPPERMRGERVTVALTKQWVAPAGRGTSATAAARSASGSRPRQSSSTSEPWRRSRIPALRRRNRPPIARVSGRRAARRRRRARPRAAAPRGGVCRATRCDGAPHPAGAATCARWQALRATSPPIEWPTRAISPTETGRRHERLEQRVERAAVLGDVAAGVVADVHRRQADSRASATP